MRIYDQNIWGNYSQEHCVGNRNLLIKELIEEAMPDFCCFQECNPYTSRSGNTPVQEILKPVYAEVLPEHADKNFTPVFYNTQSVELLDGGYFPFEGLNDMGSKSVTWGLFKEKKTGKNAVVVSAHFWWRPMNEADTLQRLENARVVTELAKELYQKYSAPVIVTGDLNSGIGADQGPGAYEKMVELGMTDVRYIAKESDNAFTCSRIYPTPDSEGNYGGGVMPDFTLDYMFVYGGDRLAANKFSVINSQKARNSSDHSPLLADFELL